MKYRVILNTGKTTTEYCDCSHCRGHESTTGIDFNELIEADSEYEAREAAIKQIKRDEGELSDKELSKIVILAPGEKILTRKAELDLLERWNKGLGLPSFQIQYEYAYDAA